VVRSPFEAVPSDIELQERTRAEAAERAEMAVAAQLRKIACRALLDSGVPRERGRPRGSPAFPCVRGAFAAGSRSTALRREIIALGSPTP